MDAARKGATWQNNLIYLSVLTGLLKVMKFVCWMESGALSTARQSSIAELVWLSCVIYF